MDTSADTVARDGISGLTYDVMLEVLKWLGRIDLHNLALSCSGMRATVAEFLANDYNADCVLRRFFDDIGSFQAVQARTRAIIGGSTALSFFTGHHWPSSDLDLYIGERYAFDMAMYLVGNGYQVVPRGEDDSTERCFPAAWIEEDDEYSTDGEEPEEAAVMDVVAEDSDMSDADDEDDGDCTDDELSPEHAYAGWLTHVYNFSAVSDPDLRVQLIVNEGSLFDCILAYHSTPVMNFLTCSRAVSLYPYHTLRGRGLCLETKVDATAALNKYKERGWNLISGVKTPDWHGFATGERYVGDELCLTMHFSGSRHDDDDIFAYDSWRLHCTPLNPHDEPTSRMQWYTRGPPMPDIPRTVPRYDYWLWIRKSMTSLNDEKEERRVCAYLGRMFDLQRLKDMRAQLKTTLADLRGSFYRERMPPYVVDMLPKKYKPQHAVDVEILINAVVTENSRLQAEIREHRQNLATM
ncbi:hypothetical protein EV121DRAFT_297257 [Schizophyllum commune]